MSDFDISQKIVEGDGKANSYFEDVLFQIGKAELATPASASDVGVPGSLKADASFLYVCVDTDTWLRVAIATW
jgi:hypothetical protein